jgi:hypothetical protein
MSFILSSPDLFDSPHTLSDREKAEPYFVFWLTFSECPLWRYKDYLYDALEACCTTDDAPFEQKEIRKNAFGLTFEIIKCLEAAKLLYDRIGKPSDPTAPKITIFQGTTEKHFTDKYSDIDSLPFAQLEAAHAYFARRMNYHYDKASEMVEMMSRCINRMTSDTGRPRSLSINKLNGRWVRKTK